MVAQLCSQSNQINQSVANGWVITNEAGLHVSICIYMLYTFLRTYAIRLLISIALHACEFRFEIESEVLTTASCRLTSLDIVGREHTIRRFSHR